MTSAICKSFRFGSANRVVSWRSAAAIMAVGLAAATPLALAQHAPGQVECQTKARQLKASLDQDFQRRESQIAAERNNEIRRCGLDTNCRNAASAKAVQLTLDNKAQFSKATSQAQAQLMQCNQLAQKPAPLVAQKPIVDETFSSNNPSAPAGSVPPGTPDRPAPLQGGATDVYRTPTTKVYKPVEGGGAYTPVPQTGPLHGGTATGRSPGAAGLPHMTGQRMFKGTPIYVEVFPGWVEGRDISGDPRKKTPGSPWNLVEGRITGPRTVYIAAVTWTNSGKREIVNASVQMNCVKQGCK